MSRFGACGDAGRHPGQGLAPAEAGSSGAGGHILFDGMGVDMSGGPLVQKQQEASVTGWLCLDWSDPSEQADTMNSFP